ncbi:hypothetical protein KOI35_44375 [Actinoplanes bogorensis]|uniref:Uncharacterized protein n=1 Tax=Paractinoplanes bogorensis TaxID=1610840 RepID=A0ABS5Z4E2_9ACTN|nr:hypothetical protein [Actinoplanes bogorensis]MBU2670559.1 hypothetical protein [Actinoplanes bogorensis]
MENDESAAAETQPPRIDDDVLDAARKARSAAAILGARKVYTRLLRETVDAEYAQAVGAIRQFNGGGAAEEAAKRAVVDINSYQVWDYVLVDSEYSDSVLSWVAGGTFAGCLVAATVHVVQEFSWSRLGLGALYLVVALASAFGTFLLLLLISESRLITARSWRNGIGTLILVASGYGLLDLYRIGSFWSEAIFVGAFFSFTLLLLVAMVTQVSRVVIALTYRHTWSRYTDQEIVQSLASVLHRLDQAEKASNGQGARGDLAGHSIRAGSTLNHVASCMEDRLPRWFGLGEGTALQTSVRQQLSGVADHVRVLAHRCLLPRAGDYEQLRESVSKLLISAARGELGAWESIDVTGAPEQTSSPREVPRRRLRLGGGLLQLIPLVLVTAGIAFLYRSNPKSSLLAPEIVGPLMAAAFAYLSTMILSGIGPGSRAAPGPDGVSGPDRPALSARIGRKVERPALPG